jgi:asparagine synthetase B (glutamine-hydrolysing)
MCGIAGWWSRRGGSWDDAEAWMRSALSDLAHRGPDDAGVWSERESGILLGHRRLSIIDLSPLGHQPMIAASGDAAIVFNGEIYNYRSLRHELAREGFAFRSDSDTEVLVNGYCRWGVSVLDLGPARGDAFPGSGSRRGEAALLRHHSGRHRIRLRDRAACTTARRRFANR